jgi:hypothetical protein
MKKEKKIVTKTKKSFFTQEEKNEILRKIYQNYMICNNLLCELNNDYDKSNIEISYLHSNLSIICKNYDICTLFLKEQKYIINENTDTAFLIFSATR